MDPSSIRRAAKRLAAVPFILFVAFWLFVEEWLWDHLAVLMEILSRMPAVRALERRIATLPPYPAMTLFLLPLALLLPFKIAALWFIARGDIVFGISLFIAAKVLGTALVAWIFSHCRPALLTVGWFSALYGWFERFRTAIYNRLEELGVFRAARRYIELVRGVARKLQGGGIARRWAAMRRLRARRLQNRNWRDR